MAEEITTALLKQDLEKIDEIEDKIKTFMESETSTWCGNLLGGFKKDGSPLPDESRPITWQGAGIAISRHPLPDYRGCKVLVVTPHAQKTRQILDMLRKDLACLNWESKREFYGCIAESLIGLKVEHMLSEAVEVIFSAAKRVYNQWLERLESGDMYFSVR